MAAPLHTSRKPLAHINITPLVDVLLILLVLVMLSATLFVKRLPVQLPHTDVQGPPVALRALDVSVRANGELYIDQSPASMEEVLRRLTPKTSVEVYADDGVTYETLAKMLARLQAAHPADISLMTR